MSLNMMPGAGYPPVNPMWMGTWHGPPPAAMGMYPCSMGMGHMQSRSQSRAPSPTHSMKSRKSTLSKKSRRKYVDSEDSDDEKDDRRSVRSERKSLGRYTVRQRPLRDTASMPREVLRRNTLDRLERSSVARSRHSIRASSSESDESPSESQKESEAMPDEEDDDVSPAKEINAPSAPQATWECEHCTFVNEAGTRVCSICCKTPTTSTVKIVVGSNENKANLPPAPKRSVEKRQKGRSSDDYSKDYSETESVQNKLMKLKVSSEDEKKCPNKIEVRKKGRTIRKISFWPGTKLQK